LDASLASSALLNSDRISASVPGARGGGAAAGGDADVGCVAVVGPDAAWPATEYGGTSTPGTTDPTASPPDTSTYRYPIDRPLDLRISIIRESSADTTLKFGRARPS
jgi:hypothetical protein